MRELVQLSFIWQCSLCSVCACRKPRHTHTRTCTLTCTCIHNTVFVLSPLCCVRRRWCLPQERAPSSFPSPLSMILFPSWRKNWRSLFSTPAREPSLAASTQVSEQASFSFLVDMNIYSSNKNLPDVKCCTCTVTSSFLFFRPPTQLLLP